MNSCNVILFNQDLLETGQIHSETIYVYLNYNEPMYGQNVNIMNSVKQREAIQPLVI